MSGHAIIINLGSFVPFVFTFNPEEVSTDKDINYHEAPNIGGSSRKLYFTGFSNKILKFAIRCIDMEDPFGVLKEISYFEALREPDMGILGISNLFGGNENYPPPQVLFGFGTGSLVPLIWDVTDIGIKGSYFHAGKVRGILGIPKVVDIDIELTLDEDNKLYKASKIARSAGVIYASVMSIAREVKTHSDNGRKEQPGFFNIFDLDF